MTNVIAPAAAPKKKSLLETLKLSTDYSAAGVKNIITQVPIRKPPKHDFFRVHPDADYRCDMALLVYGDEKDTFFVAHQLQEELIGHMKPFTLLTYINRQGVTALWPIRLAGTDNEHPAWETARIAAEMATEQWVRVQYNRSLNGYETFPATQIKAEPQWPDLTFEDLVEIASRGKIIDTMDHIVLRKLRGEV